MPACVETSPKLLALPSSFELAGLLRSVLREWGFFSAGNSGSHPSHARPLSLEFMLKLGGPLEAVLVLRSSRDFAADLAFASTGDPIARILAPEAFKEFCNLTAEKLVMHYLPGAENSFSPASPRPSAPASWPQWQASAECLLLAESHLLEARLWVKGRGL